MSSAEQHSNERSAGSIISIPWDVEAFGFPCYEVTDTSAMALETTVACGHYTAKVDPLTTKQFLLENDFYYCDTLMEPYCRPEMFKPVYSQNVSICDECSLKEILLLSKGAYRHGRYHRDFNVPVELADLRYDNWIRDLYDSGSCFGLLYKSSLAAYFGTNGNKVVLHAVAEEFRGKGLAKHLWSAGYRKMLDRGFLEVFSSVSASNTAVINLYASLGFRFRNPLDVYHKFVSANQHSSSFTSAEVR
jgi:GNAT superfamily N-acetyltransferase